MNIYIVRHGETKANLKLLMQGQSESDLTDFGRVLAEETGKGLKNIKFDAVYSSPLRRAYETAEIILKNNLHKDVKIIKDDRLKEINLGNWEGKTFSGDKPEINPLEVKAFFSNPFTIKNVYHGEDVYAVIKRTKDFLLELATKDYQNVLVTSHGYAIRAMLNFLYENPNDFWQGRVPLNCATNILKYDKNFKFIARDKIYYDDSKAVNHYKLEKE